MASWAFRLGFLGFLAILLSPAMTIWPAVLPFMVYGGLALAALAVVLGLVGLPSINRASAFAGLLLGLLAIVGYYYFIRPLVRL
jgi:hypothetical protein